MLKKSLSDAAKLHVKMEGVDLGFDRGSIVVGCPVQILIAMASTEGLHSGHPEVVGVCPQDVDSLTETKFDSESVCVKDQDLQGFKGEVGGQKEDGAAQGMAYDHEPDHARSGPPDQIQAPVAQRDVVFPVNGAGR